MFARGRRASTWALTVCAASPWELGTDDVGCGVRFETSPPPFVSSGILFCTFLRLQKPSVAPIPSKDGGMIHVDTCLSRLSGLGFLNLCWSMCRLVSLGTIVVEFDQDGESDHQRELDHRQLTTCNECHNFSDFSRPRLPIPSSIAPLECSNYQYVLQHSRVRIFPVCSMVLTTSPCPSGCRDRLYL